MTSDERALQAWFTELARCVNDTDFPAGRRLFADDIVSFGTFTTLMHGLEDYATQQWPHVWPYVQHFRFGPAISRWTRWSVARWRRRTTTPHCS